MHTESTLYWHGRGYTATMGRLNHDHTLTAEAQDERHKLGAPEDWDGYKQGVLAALDDYIRTASQAA